MKPIPIKTLLLHTNFHLDEAETVYLLTSYGKESFPGVEKARVMFTQGLEPHTDCEFDSQGILPIGCGQARFDEHRDKGRLPDECATTLASKYLKIEDLKEVKQISNEVLRCDTMRGVKCTELAEIIKMAHRQINGASGNEYVLKWSMVMLNALHSQIFSNFVAVPGEHTLQEIFNKLEKMNRFPDLKARESLRNLVEESMSRKDKSITELSFLVECLYRTRVENVIDYVRFALEHLYLDQCEFWNAVAECKKGVWFESSAVCNRCGKQTKQTIKILLIHSDSMLMHRAARHRDAGKADVIILRNRKENVSVFVDAQKGINLSAFTRMVRWLELPKDARGRPTLDISWEELGREGKLKEVPDWFFFKRAQQLHNGSLTNPSVSHTLINDKALIEIARRAFDPVLIGRWTNARGITVRPKAEVPSYAKTATDPTTNDYEASLDDVLDNAANNC